MTAVPHPMNAAGHLCIGGVDALDIAHEFQTPVIVYDVADIRSRARAFRAAFDAEGVAYQVAYASNALSIIAMYQVMLEEHLCVDAVSAGELFTALHAGVPAERVHFHGNNKSDGEMRYALQAGVGCFVVDSMREVQRLPQIAAEVFELSPTTTDTSAATTTHVAKIKTTVKDTGTNGARVVTPLSSTSPPASPLSPGAARRVVRVLLRVAPGVTAHTHEYNTTGQVDSKFGLDVASGQATQAYHALQAHPHVQVIGLHCHIGSQIFQSAGHVSAALRLMALMDSWGMTACVLNVGGGFGVRYTQDDTPLPLPDYIHAIVSAVKAYVASSSSSLIEVPAFWIEPGRSLISEAGTTLYTVSSQKVVPGVRTYLTVDGGMSDNIRPVTCQAVYRAALAGKMKVPADHTYTIVGNLCESGDQLIHSAVLPEAEEGDVLSVFCTGAYCYAMASNYSKLCRPAVVFVEMGKATVVVRRESLDDLIRNELSLPSGLPASDDDIIIADMLAHVRSLFRCGCCISLPSFLAFIAFSALLFSAFCPLPPPLPASG
jgi:diaminopimelate decarboxylase